MCPHWGAALKAIKGLLYCRSRDRRLLDGLASPATCNVESAGASWPTPSGFLPAAIPSVAHAWRATLLAMSPAQPAGKWPSPHVAEVLEPPACKPYKTFSSRVQVQALRYWLL